MAARIELRDAAEKSAGRARRLDAIALYRGDDRGARRAGRSRGRATV